MKVLLGVFVFVFALPFFCYLIFLPIEGFKQVNNIDSVIFDWLTIIIGWMLVLFLSFKTAKTVIS